MIPGLGINIPHTVQWGQSIKKKKKRWMGEIRYLLRTEFYLFCFWLHQVLLLHGHSLVAVRGLLIVEHKL